MTPQQQQNLETLIGRPLTAEEITTITPMVKDSGYLAIAMVLVKARKKRNPDERYSSLGIAKYFQSINGLPPALASEMVLQKIEGFAEEAIQSTDPIDKLLGAQIKRQMTHLYSDGIEIGDPAIGEMLAPIVQAGKMTQEEVDILQDVSLEEYPVSESEIRDALEE